MLYKSTVDQPTFELLRQLQSRDYLKGFYLVGGTALALRIGHRKSIDLDLFCTHDFDANELLENLSADFGFVLFFSGKNTLKGSINDVKIDILAHRYPLIGTPLIEDGIKLISLEDIAAMKLNAIAVSGQRIKDFIDIYFLLQIYTIEEMLGFYKTKYSQFHDVNVLKSLCWFEDVDPSEWPVLIKSPRLGWKTISRTIEKAILEFIRKQNL